MATLQTYEIASRKHKSVTAIPWAEAVVISTAPPTAYLAVKNLGIKPLERTLIVPRLDTYPVTIPDIARFIGAQLIRTRRRLNRPREIIEFDITVRTIVLIPASALHVAWGIQKENKISFKRKLQTLELNSYPATTSPGQPLTSFLAKPYSIRQEQRNLLSIEELNTHPATPAIPQQPMTSFLAKPYFIRQEKRQSLNIQEHDFYPQPVTSPAILPALFKTDIIFRSVTKRNALKSDPAPSSLVKITLGLGPGFGVGSVLSNNGIGETGLITNDGIGKVGEI